MFIETLEFTIPVDLCDLFSTMKSGTKSNVEFPASVNSYGTTQDANIQVVLKANKLTFKVDGVSSSMSMISKSECKTLRLSVFDVDCSLFDAGNESMSHSVHNTSSRKRSHDDHIPMKHTPSKSRRTYSEATPSPSTLSNSPAYNPELESRLQPDITKVKQEPDLIELDPDNEQYEEVKPKAASQAVLNRLSHSQESISQSPLHRGRVPHVQNSPEAGTSHGDSNQDDFLVFQQGSDDYGDDNDNSADYGNNGEMGAKKNDNNPLHEHKLSPSVPTEVQAPAVQKNPRRMKIVYTSEKAASTTVGSQMICLKRMMTRNATKNVDSPSLKSPDRGKEKQQARRASKSMSLVVSLSRESMSSERYKEEQQSRKASVSPKFKFAEKNGKRPGRTSKSPSLAVSPHAKSESIDREKEEEQFRTSESRLMISPQHESLSTEIKKEEQASSWTSESTSLGNSRGPFPKRLYTKIKKGKQETSGTVKSTSLAECRGAFPESRSTEEKGEAKQPSTTTLSTSRQDNNRQLSCTHCNRSFKSTEDLAYHIKANHKCLCGQVFRFQSGLMSHKQVCLKVKKIKKNTNVKT